MNRILNLEWLQHLIFWMLSILFFTYYFSISNEISEIDLIYSVCFHICLFPLSYILLYLLIPFFLDKERYLIFILAAIVNVLLSLAIHNLVFDFLVVKLLPGYYIVSFTDTTILVVIFSVYSGLTILLKLSKSFFRVKKIEFEKNTLELTTIRNQLNPHFLFNGLNSISSLSLDKDERTSKAILQLSDILRFVLYEINEKTIPISKEVEMIEKYIEIQLLRLDNPGNISFDRKGNFQHQIVPMLFFPLVENAFKHGDLHLNNSKIEIEIDSNELGISFKCINSFDKLHTKSGEKSGIGIKTVQKSLEHHYGRKAIFEIKEGDQIFETSIIINF